MTKLKKLRELYNNSTVLSEVPNFNKIDYLLVNPAISTCISGIDYIKEFSDIISKMDFSTESSQKFSGNDKMFYCGGMIGVDRSAISINGKVYEENNKMCVELLSLYNSINNKISNYECPYAEMNVVTVKTLDSIGHDLVLDEKELIAANELINEIKIYNEVINENNWQWSLYYIGEFTLNDEEQLIIFAGNYVIQINGILYNCSFDTSNNLINFVKALRQ